MSFQFVNNWPYSNTVFPTMLEHVDPVNNEYFTGLLTELARIEYYLGINPQGAFGTVAKRLDELTLPIPGYWEGVNFVGTLESFSVDPNNVGTSYAGFAYYNFVYLGPCERDFGNRKVRSFNTLNDEHFWQDSIITSQPRGAVLNGSYGVFSIGGTPGSILRFNPETWAEVETSLGAGNNYPNQLVNVGANCWTPCTTSPARLVRYTTNNHAVANWEMEAGENECRAICTDGTYLWFCCNTDPVLLIRFTIADKSHVTFIINGFLPEVTYMAYIDGMVYMFSDNAAIQWARFDTTILAFQRFEADLPFPFKSGALWGDKIALMLSDGSTAYMAIFKPSVLFWWLSRELATSGLASWLTIAMDHAVWAGSISQNVDWEATLLDPT